MTESKELSSKQLEKKLNCNNISKNVFVVHTSWLVDCVKNSSHLQESSYHTKVSRDDVDSNSNLDSGFGMKRVESDKDETDESVPYKKTKFLESGPSSTSESTSMIYPIIPNPISYPDFVPIYGSWQEYRSVMYKFTKPSERSK